MDRGAYCLIMRLGVGKEIEAGRRPSVRFPKGYYCYVGSAMGGLEKRISRHLSREKRLRWHIDFFLEHARIVDVIRIESKERLECALSRKVEALSDCSPAKGFGSSDCLCRSHLHHFRENPARSIEKMVRKWKNSLGNTGREGKR